MKSRIREKIERENDSGNDSPKEEAETSFDEEEEKRRVKRIRWKKQVKVEGKKEQNEKESWELKPNRQLFEIVPRMIVRYRYLRRGNNACKLFDDASSEQGPKRRRRRKRRSANKIPAL